MTCAWSALAPLLALAPLAGAGAAEPAVSSLQAACRSGQVFLTWQEADTPPGTTFNVYLSDRPITASGLAAARRIGHHVERHSARDWWQDPASFNGKAAPGAPAGFRIQVGAPPLDPSGGLFVHTVTPEDEGARFLAVTTTDAAGIESTPPAPGQSALAEPVLCRVAPVQPIWIGPGEAPAPGAGRGKSLTLNLHGRGGGVTAGTGAAATQYLLFGDAKQGWREGLAIEFGLKVSARGVDVIPYDRAWTGGRPVTESWDARDHCPAVATFWYGYNRRIYETTQTETIVAPNYTEEVLLGMVRWAQARFGTDPNRTYIRGGSMGGSGAVSVALHHPTVFAAVAAHVPIYSYTRPGAGSARRLECACGPLDRPARNQDGVPLLDHMDGAKNAAEATGDLPYILATNGRRDGSIPWENNPPFYRAMEAARQGFSVYWSDGDHGSVDREAPADVKAWDARLERFRLNESYPAFSHCSDNRDPGRGDPQEGDIIGWINRGLDWSDVVDTPKEYALTVTADHPELKLPITVDVTPRRVQRFALRPGAVVKLQVGTAPPAAATVDEGGRLTIRGVRIADAGGTRIRVTR